jgi:hypothetical protein
MATGCMAEDLRFESLHGLEIFLFSIASRPAQEPTQPPIQGVPWLLPREQSDRSVKITIYLHLLLRLRMRGAISPLLIRPIGTVLNQAHGHDNPFTIILGNYENISGI